MRKLRQFQDRSHDVTFLIGTFTSLIGDPSDKDKARDQLTPEQVDINAQTYAEQAFEILDSSGSPNVRRNDEWLSLVWISPTSFVLPAISRCNNSLCERILLSG
jgi:tyrosyl-tRNA synthetase